MASVERHLLRLSEEVVGVAVQRQLADLADGDKLLRDDLRCVEQVEIELVLVSRLDDLKAELPFREVATLNGFPEVAPVEVRITTAQEVGLVPDQRTHAFQGLPVKLDETPTALGIDEAEGVDAEPLHGRVAARQRAIAHEPHQHMRALGRQRYEIPERVMRRLRLRYLVVRLGLDRVDKVGELVRVLDEEHRHVVAD